MREVIMGYQGEMSLKGLNRNQFESTMMKILRYRLKTVGKKIFPRRGQHRNPNPAAQKKTGLKNSPAGSVRLLPRPP